MPSCVTVLVRPVLRHSTLALAVGLALLGAATLAGADRAHAGDEPRRVLRIRDLSDGPSQSEEWLRQAEERRMEAIRRLKGVLGSSVPEAQRPEMFLRLADLYFQQGRQLYLDEMRDFELRYKACFDDPACRAEELQADNRGSRDWQRKSIDLYQTLLSSYPRYERADQASFYLGSALQDLGRTDDNVFGALKAYERAAAFTDHPKAAYATYMLAWCTYNVGDIDRSIALMKAVVRHAEEHPDSPSGIQLEEEALRDLVRFFADGDATRATEFDFERSL